jgi:hypothetical protein
MISCARPYFNPPYLMLWWNMEIAKKVFEVPRCRSFTDFLRSHGVPVILVDCDGNVEQFLPLVIEGGLNGFLPFEVAAGNDRRALARDKAAIDGEIEEKVRPMLAEGRHFPMLDHYALPDISFENYLYYRRRLKALRSAP